MEAGNRNARSFYWRGASQIGATPFTQILQSFVGKFVEPSGSNIRFELLVPGFRVEIREPRAKTRKLLARKLANGRFDLFNAAHAGNLPTATLLCKRLAHAETLRAMEPKAEVIVPEYRQAVEI